jgi:hypothetical protein
MIPKKTTDAVRALLAQHFSNPTRNAARQARAAYIGELFAASHRGDDVDHPVEAAEWLKRLHELCGPHAEIEDIKRWYQLEETRLLKLIDPQERRST